MTSSFTSISLTAVAIAVVLMCASSSQLINGLPQNLTTAGLSVDDKPSPSLNASSSSSSSLLHLLPPGWHRQARTDISSLARFITPDNVAQMKSLFSGISQYGASGLSSALTFNVGNLVILTLIAGLAILVAPTLLGLFGLGTFGGFGRSLGLTNEHGQLVDTERVYRAMDSFFQEYNIDAKTCLQRFACTASRKSSSAVRGGNPSYMDSALNYLLESKYVTTVLDKTSMLDAVNFGKSGGDCEIEYGKCPFSWEKVTQYLPFSGIKLSSPFFGGQSSPSTTTTTTPPLAPVH